MSNYEAETVIRDPGEDDSECDCAAIVRWRSLARIFGGVAAVFGVGCFLMGWQIRAINADNRVLRAAVSEVRPADVLEMLSNARINEVGPADVLNTLSKRVDHLVDELRRIETKFETKLDKLKECSDVASH